MRHTSDPLATGEILEMPETPFDEGDSGAERTEPDTGHPGACPDEDSNSIFEFSGTSEGETRDDPGIADAGATGGGALASDSGGFHLDCGEGSDKATTIGRYKIVRLLGEGGFGVVYLADDPRLDRQVAIKIPRSDKVIDEFVWKGFISEGRAVAALKHESIVAIYDTDRTSGGIPYVVMEYINGRTLTEFIRKEKPGYQRKLELLRQIADALRYAHRESIVHRDLKPANIIVDNDGRAKIMDFGLALRVDQPMGRMRTGAVGTLAFMAPEQARAENHRIDGRSDIWSLGVIMYWMFTGKRPFVAENATDFAVEICNRDPKPMRQLDDRLPAELDNVCQRCLQKLMPDRYQSAADLVSDLDFLIEQSSLYQIPGAGNIGRLPEGPSAGSRPAKSGPEFAANARKSGGSISNSGGSSGLSDPIRIVPRGMRSFDLDDAEFFGELLPGPVDRFGVPESLRFWTRALAGEHDSLPVGLIFGPSGCGKSSFVKAGLIPRLPEEYECIYLECSRENTTENLRSALIRRIEEEIPDHIDTVDLVIGLRNGRYSTRSNRLLIVLDQFEQFLSGPDNQSESMLVNSLRQCDGVSAQALVLIRDDFWMPVQQFFKRLGYRIQDGRNSMALPLFDKRHARKVLHSFGRAFEQLPANSTKISRQQRHFLAAAVDEIASNDRVICGHLSLFADLMQHRPWTQSEYARAGGWNGLALHFLEQTFSEPNARPDIRPHCRSISGILETLLPESDKSIKGSSLSRRDIVEQVRGKDPDSKERGIDNSLQLLDEEFRFITRVEHDRDYSSSAAQEKSMEPAYQLSHDVLVGPIRKWLQVKQGATWQGRATAKLKQLAGNWERRPVPGNIPTVTEHMQILSGVPRSAMTPAMKSLHRAATKFYAIRTAIVVGLLALAVGTYFYSTRFSREQLVSSHIDRVEQVPVPGLPATYELLSSEPGLAMTVLDERITNAESDEKRFRLQLAKMQLQTNDQIDEQLLLNAIVTMPDRFSGEIINAIQRTSGDSRERVCDWLRECLTKEEDLTIQARAATVLLTMGEFEILNEYLKFSVAPDQRTAFVHNLAGWSPGLDELLDALELPMTGADRLSVDSRYSLLLGLCTMDGPFSDEQCSRLETIVLDHYQSSASHPALQAASLAVMRQQKFEIPDLMVGLWDQFNRISCGDEILQFNKIPAGTIQLGRESLSVRQLPDGVAFPEDLPPRPDLILKMKSPYWMSSTSITAAAFMEFIEDPEVVRDLKKRGAHPLLLYNSIKDWKVGGPYCADGVSCIAAMEFCNWLSRQENLRPFYHIEYEGLPDEFNPAMPTHSLRLTGLKRLDTNGFRLPTFEEYEYAARAGTATPYFFGSASRGLDLEPFYGRYNVPEFQDREVAACLPSPFGLFDTNGSISQWCDINVGINGFCKTYGSQQRGNGDCTYSGNRPMSNNTMNGVGFRVVRPCLR